MRPLVILLTLLSFAACGQDTNAFHAYAGTDNLIEGGRVQIVIADWGDQRCTIRCPIGFSSHVDDTGRMIKFDANGGAAAINISFTTNSPGELPPPEILKSIALARHPGATYIQSFNFPTSSRPGLYFDLAQAPAANESLRTRHGFIPTRKGIVEFAFSASNPDFEHLRVGCMQSLGTFAIEPIKPKETGQ